MRLFSVQEVNGAARVVAAIADAHRVEQQVPVPRVAVQRERVVRAARPALAFTRNVHTKAQANQRENESETIVH